MTTMGSKNRRADVFVDDDKDPRTDVSATAGERETLVGFLRWQRQTLELKCSGLGAADLARRSVEPSTMSLLGLVRHMADVERGWFRSFMAGEDAPPPFQTQDDHERDFDGALADPQVVAGAWGARRGENADADPVLGGAS